MIWYQCTLFLFAFHSIRMTNEVQTDARRDVTCVRACERSVWNDYRFSFFVHSNPDQKKIFRILSINRIEWSPFSLHFLLVIYKNVFRFTAPKIPLFCFASFYIFADFYYWIRFSSWVYASLHSVCTRWRYKVHGTFHICENFSMMQSPFTLCLSLSPSGLLCCSGVATNKIII